MKTYIKCSVFYKIDTILNHRNILKNDNLYYHFPDIPYSEFFKIISFSELFSGCTLYTFQNKTQKNLQYIYFAQLRHHPENTDSIDENTVCILSMMP